MKNNMGGACSTFGGQERCLLSFDEETGGKQTTLKTYVLLGG